jgi:hypothetical protein
MGAKGHQADLVVCVSAWKNVGVFLVFVGMMWMISPLLSWAVLNDFGSFLYVAIVVAIGAAFFVGGLIIMRNEEG